MANPGRQWMQTLSLICCYLFASVSRNFIMLLHYCPCSFLPPALRRTTKNAPRWRPLRPLGRRPLPPPRRSQPHARPPILLPRPPPQRPNPQKHQHQLLPKPPHQLLRQLERLHSRLRQRRRQKQKYLCRLLLVFPGGQQATASSWLTLKTPTILSPPLTQNQARSIGALNTAPS